MYARAVLAVAVMLAASTAVAQQKLEAVAPPAETPPGDLTQQASYCIGLSLGDNFRRQRVQLDFEALNQGIRDGLANAEPKLSEEQIEKVMQAFQEQVGKMIAETNLKEGKAFLAANTKKEGVVTLPSGLQYKVIKKGDGPSPKATDTVTTHYRGTLLDGTEFDSSYGRGEPASFPVNGVIKAWQEALPMMKVGDKWELYVPAELGYGARGAGGDIGPNATLLFEVELLSIGGM